MTCPNGRAGVTFEIRMCCCLRSQEGYTALGRLRFLLVLLHYDDRRRR